MHRAALPFEKSYKEFFFFYFFYFFMLLHFKCEIALFIILLVCLSFRITCSPASR